MNEHKTKLDWIYLPPNIEENSLWSCLHDGELISCKSDHPERLVTLEFQVDHLVEDKESPASFLLNLEEVTSVRATGYFRRIGEFEEPENASLAERSALIKEYQAKWREESLSWSEFETALVTDPLQISDARYVSANDETTLRIGGFLDGEKFDDIYVDVFLRGRKVSAARSDGKDFSFSEFIKLGNAYWESFGNKN